MKKLVCYFSGWFEICIDEVQLTDPHHPDCKTQTAEQWLQERGNINDLILASFNEANEQATNGSFEELRLEIE
jgi:hypothetical protein